MKTVVLDKDPLWYKDAIIYHLHVKAYFDGNDDGIGDFRGLTQKLDYIQDLGVNTLWLLPFYPSPMRDDGYDIADYKNIHPDYGTRQDFRAFVREAHRRGLRIITELIINHTSDQHPWFQAARRARPGSAKRDFYVWSDSDRKFPETRIIFTDTEASNWTWDPVAKAYYWHRFFSHQPDLNHNNPQVVKAVIRLMRFWLDMGVDGLRLDAVPYLCVREGTNNENLPETHEVIKQMRAVVDAHYADRVFLAEANQWPEDVRAYFGDGDECHMAYHFPLMPRMYMAVAQEDRHPIVEIMGQTPEIPESCQWAIFLRNHDELTLEMVTDKERDYMYRTYASDPRMRINVGIRRRLAPLMENDSGKIRLLDSLLLSMPGSPIVYYGDELGMGDNIYLGDRNSVRTPMQWSPDRNAGFSRADPQRLYLPPVMDPIFGYQAVNVESRSRAPASLLNWMKRLIAVRRSHQAFGRGSLTFLHPGNRKILAYLRELGDACVLCVANLSRSAQPVELDLSRFLGRIPVEMLGRTPFPRIGELPYLLTLPGHGFYWFLLSTEAEAPAWHEDRLPPAELMTLVLFAGWDSFFPERIEGAQRSLAERLRAQFERDVLPTFLPGQRWFAAKGERLRATRLILESQWQGRETSWMLARAEVQLDSGDQAYFLPLGLVWEEDDERMRELRPAAVAKVRRQARTGFLFDALADERFCRELVTAMAGGREIPFGEGHLACSTTGAFTQIVGDVPEALAVHRPGTEGTNTTVVLGDRAFLKVYRRLQDGINPELEIGRFLTEVSPGSRIVPVAGSVEYVNADGTSTTLALLQAYVENQGDGWSYTLAYLSRYLEDCCAQPPEEAETAHAPYLGMMGTLGRRTAELHQALAPSTGDPAFDPEPIGAGEPASWAEQIRKDVVLTLGRLAERQRQLAPELQADVARLLEAQNALLESVQACTPVGLSAAKTRHHGDFHLGQVLVAEDDFVIVDFEGEPARAPAERRRKVSPLRDVAGMLRSLSYAAYTAQREIAEKRRDPSAGLDALARERLLVQDWERQAAAAFLDGYRETASGCPSYPADPKQASRLIDLFVLEKVLYEVRYELDNRPDWAYIPVAALLARLA